MTLRCTICGLDPTKRAAIDSALYSGVSLQTLADENGFTKSALWRHSRQVAGYNAAATQPKAVANAKTPVPAPPKVARPVKPPPLASQETSAPAPELKGEPLDVETRRRQALERCELLFREALDGLV